jgi:hypothetical protein
MNFCFDSVVKKMIHLYDEVNNFKSLTLSFSKGIKLVKKIHITKRNNNVNNE